MTKKTTRPQEHHQAVTELEFRAKNSWSVISAVIRLLMKTDASYNNAQADASIAVQRGLSPDEADCKVDLLTIQKGLSRKHEHNQAH